jgi:hypothetical protein
MTAERILAVATAEVPPDRLASELSRIGNGNPKVRVTAPAVASSGLKQELGDVDDAIGEAGERLQRMLRGLRERGVDASGSVGDSDPVQAISDQLQAFDADQILLVGHRDEESVYAEHDVLERARRDFEQPIVELLVSERGAADATVTDRIEAPPDSGDDERTIEPSANLPPFSVQDLAGMAVAGLGTALLIFLAVDCAGAADGPITGGCAIRILIAGAAALINLAHVVALFLFDSVRYRGLWERVLARLTLIGTPLAIVASLLVG